MYDFKGLALFALKISVGDPSSFHEAMSDKDKDRWLGTIVEEMESLDNYKIWESVVLRLATSEKEEKKFMARLVAKRYSQ